MQQLIQLVLKSLSLFLSLCLCIGLTSAQPINQELGDVVTPTPESTSLGKYVDVPIDYSTGTPNISVPVLTIVENKLKLPITLSYHTSLRAGDMASWCGLGWSLNGAGGQISRTVQGKPDESPNGYFFGEIDLNTAEQIANESLFDSQPDIFTISGPVNAKFFIDTGKVPKVVDQTQHLKVEILEGTSPILEGFIVTIPDGTRYIYGKDGTRTARESLTTNSNADYTNAWKLLRIQSYDLTDHLLFNYEQESYSYKTLATCIKEYSNLGSPINQVKCPGRNGIHTIGGDAYNYITHTISGFRLTSITTGSQSKTVNFIGNTDRLDLGNTSKRLDYIDFQTGGKCQRFDFHYSYFKDPTTSSFRFGYRLKLDSLQELSSFTPTVKKEPWKFRYASSQNADGSQYMPHRLTKRIDHWGFYNGKTLNDDLLVLAPSTDLEISNSGILESYGCADRNSSQDSMKIGILDQITYPTKGTRTYEYEAHTVSQLSSSQISGGFNDLATCGTLGPGCCGEMGTESQAISFINTSQINTATYDIEIANMGCTGITPKVTVEIFDSNGVSKGSKNLSISSGMNNNASGKLTDISNMLQIGEFYTFHVSSINGRGSFSLQFNDVGLINAEVGGLRIKSITAHDNIDQANDIVKSYQYNIFDSEQSSGTLLSEPVYGSSAHDMRECGSTEFIAEWSGSPSMVLSEYEGRHIVYNRVRESIPGAGSTVYEFNSDAVPYPTNYFQSPPEDFVNPGTISSEFLRPPRPYNFSNGELKKKIEYYEDGSIFREERYTKSTASGYEDADATVLMRRVFTQCQPLGNTTLHIGAVQFYRPRVGRYLLGQKTLIQDGVTTDYNYTYDTEKDHYYIKTESVTNSDNNKHITEYSFPDEYETEENATIGAALLDKNLLQPPWKIEKYVTNTTPTNRTDGTKTIWSTFNEGILYPDSLYRYEKTYNVTGAAVAGATWDPQYDIKSYDSATGKPTALRYHGWNDDVILEWSASGKLTQHRFKEYVTNITYHGNSDLIETYTNIDGSKLTYQWDDLIRPIQIKDNDRDLTIDIDYIYESDPNKKSYKKVSTKYDKFGSFSAPITLRTLYFVDGLSRPIQTKKVKQGPFYLQSVVLNTQYDSVGRVARLYEPRIILNFTEDFEQIKGDSTETLYEANMASRPVQVTDAAGFTKFYSYGRNSSSFSVSGYTNNSLFRHTTTDGRGNVDHVFTDRLGNQILARSENSDGTLTADTKWLYDDKLRPTTIIPPGASISNTDLITSYLYYGSDLIKEKKLPDADPVKYTYDERELMTFSQDGEQRAFSNSGRWIMYALDDYGRVVSEGWSEDKVTLDQMYLQNIWGNTGNDAGKLRRQIKYMTNDPTNIKRFFYTYDDAGRLTNKEYSTFLLSANRAVKESYTYDSADNILTETHDHSAYTTDPNIFTFTHNYDHAGRPSTTHFGRGTSMTDLLCTKSYTAKDQIEKLTIGDTLQECDFEYLPNQFLKNMNGTSLSTSDLFQSELSYDPATNIDRCDWETIGDQSYYYTYNYDFLNRLLDAKQGGNVNNAFSSSFVYKDYRGNLSSITRIGNTNNAILDNMTFNYGSNTNCFASISENGTLGLQDSGYSGMSGTYMFNKNGAMISDPARQATIENEYFNLPRSITKNANNHITYSYDWTGTLHRTETVINGIAEIRDYAGPAEYVNGKLDLIKHEHGYIKPNLFNNGLLKREGDTDHDDIKYWENIYSEEIEISGNDVELYFEKCGEMDYPFEVKDGAEYLIAPESQTGDQFFWNIKDHLGNVRVVFDNDLNILEKNNYYAFGMRWTDQQNQFNYTYNGKEEQRGIGAGLLAYGFRFYDPAIGRFTSIGPLAEIYSYQSPYVYADNNPIKYIDFMGLGSSYNWDTGKYEDEDGNEVSWNNVQSEYGIGSSSSSSDDGDDPIKKGYKGKVELDVATPIRNSDGSPNEDAYNCHSYAWTDCLGGPNDPANQNLVEFGITRWDNDPMNNAADHTALDFDAPNLEGDKVVYFAWDETSRKVIATHSAVVSKVNDKGRTVEVQSKWGQAPLYRHHPRDVPTSYGAKSPTFVAPDGKTYASRIYFRKK